MERLLKQRMAARRGEAGFTLVELAIVLVIIGLIIGGVLVGQDLIKAAEIRATISQIESYNAAVNTFRGRFNGLPGDIRNVTDFFDTATWTDMVNGDGDRLLESCALDAAPTVGVTSTDGKCDGEAARAEYTFANGEIMQFWHHLSAAELVPGFFDGLGCTAACAQGTSGTLDISFPRVKLDRNGINVYGDAGRNYYQVGAIEDLAAADDTYATAPSLTPEEANNLDTKVDDGRPNTGSVRALGDTVPNTALVDAEVGDAVGDDAPTAGAYSAVFCGVGNATATATDVAYAILNPEVACQLRFRMN